MSPNSLFNESWLPRFEVHLHQQGYHSQTVQRYLAVSRRFLQYLQARGIALEAVCPEILEAYFHSQLQIYQQRHGHPPRDANCSRHLFNRGITLLLRLAQGKWPPPTAPTNMWEIFHQQVCADYARWLASCRGLSPQTIASRCAHGQKFLGWLGERGAREHLPDLTLADIDAYLEAKAPLLRRSSRADLTFCLRGFLSYLYTQKLITRDLARAVASPTLYAFERIPSALKSEDVSAVLETAQQDRTPTGLRNFAILLLLSTYGLRAGEVARLRLEDIDWRRECLRVRHSKTGTETVLPLLAPVGHAILDYLRDGRPHTQAREIFIRAQAPYQPFCKGSSLYTLVARRLEKAGIHPEGKRGPHAFRHARAVSLLHAAVPLKAIGDILGHKTTASTTPYLKLATADLRAVGLEVPKDEEVQP